jgi:hypothetical protein
MEPKETQNTIEAAAKGRPYNLIRQVGNRIEVHFLGDYDLTVIEKGKAGVPAGVLPATGELHKQKVSYLRKMAVGLGIKTTGLRKVELIKAIIKAME